MNSSPGIGGIPAIITRSYFHRGVLYAYSARRRGLVSKVFGPQTINTNMRRNEKNITEQIENVCFYVAEIQRRNAVCRKRNERISVIIFKKNQKKQNSPTEMSRRLPASKRNVYT